MNILKPLLARVLGWLALIASGGITMSCPAYGVEFPDGDPNVEITDFSYTPGTVVERGDTMEFKVTLSRTPLDIYAQRVTVYVGEINWGSYRPTKWTGFTASLGARDDGLPPDAVANDQVYTASWQVPANYPIGWDIPVEAHYHDDERGGPYFTVEDGE